MGMYARNPRWRSKERARVRKGWRRYKPSEVAAALCAPPATVYSWIKRGQLPASNPEPGVWLIKHSSLRRAMNQRWFIEWKVRRHWKEHEGANATSKDERAGRDGGKGEGRSLATRDDGGETKTDAELECSESTRRLR